MRRMIGGAQGTSGPNRGARRKRNGQVAYIRAFFLF